MFYLITLHKRMSWICIIKCRDGKVNSYPVHNPRFMEQTDMNSGTLVIDTFFPNIGVASHRACRLIIMYNETLYIIKQRGTASLFIPPPPPLITNYTICRELPVTQSLLHPMLGSFTFVLSHSSNWGYLGNLGSHGHMATLATLVAIVTWLPWQPW